MPFRFEGLQIWPLAVEYADSIYLIAAGFPEIERYSLASQITRAANSVRLNIAEGAGRDTKTDFNRFLGIALGSTFETASALRPAKDRKYISNDQYDNLYDQADKLGRTISKFRKTLMAK